MEETESSTSYDSDYEMRLTVREDVGAELDEFLCLKLLGCDEDALKVVEELLWRHLRFFPVFAEIAGSAIEENDMSLLQRLLEFIQQAEVCLENPEELQFLADVQLIRQSPQVAAATWTSLSLPTSEIIELSAVMRHLISLRLFVAARYASSPSQMFQIQYRTLHFCSVLLDARLLADSTRYFTMACSLAANSYASSVSLRTEITQLFSKLETKFAETRTTLNIADAEELQSYEFAVNIAYLRLESVWCKDNNIEAFPEIQTLQRLLMTTERYMLDGFDSLSDSTPRGRHFDFCAQLKRDLVVGAELLAQQDVYIEVLDDNTTVAKVKVVETNYSGSSSRDDVNGQQESSKHRDRIRSTTQDQVDVMFPSIRSGDFYPRAKTEALSKTVADSSAIRPNPEDLRSRFASIMSESDSFVNNFLSQIRDIEPEDNEELTSGDQEDSKKAPKMEDPETEEVKPTLYDTVPNSQTPEPSNKSPNPSGSSRQDIMHQIGCRPSNAIERAVCEGDREFLATLLREAQNPSSTTESREGPSPGTLPALHFAALFGEVEMALDLIEAGYDINEAPRGQKPNVTALSFAIGAHQESMVAFLVEHGAGPVMPDTWATLAGRVMNSSWLGMTTPESDRQAIDLPIRGIFDFLLKQGPHGWEINDSVNKSGQTVLHQAVSLANDPPWPGGEDVFYRIAQYLHGGGADPLRRNLKGDTPSDLIEYGTGTARTKFFFDELFGITSDQTASSSKDIPKRIHVTRLNPKVDVTGTTPSASDSFSSEEDDQEEEALTMKT